MKLEPQEEPGNPEPDVDDQGFTKVEYEGESSNQKEGAQLGGGVKKRGLIKGIKNKLEEVKKQWAPKINEKLLYVTASLN